MIYRAAVALGSNLGDRLQTLREAVAGLGRLGRLERVSSLYETAPVGGPEQQGRYLNAVVVLETDLEPVRLLEGMHRLEVEAGRVRRERWGPRTLDLDLIAVADEAGRWLRSRQDELQLPHPGAHLRRFVLEPLAEVWPAARVGDGVAAADLVDSVADQDVACLGSRWTHPRLAAARSLFLLQIVLSGGYGAVLVATGEMPGSITRPVIALGVILAVAGLALAGWAVVSLGTFLSPYPEPRPGTRLVAVGPYRLVRHPIYTGLVVLGVGMALAAGSWAAAGAAAVLGWFFWHKARYEETRLRLAVPGYAAYQQEVRGRLVPVTKDPTQDR
ncbi:MAG: 2-amino-4-hydroxy-6-hydroxymethyldihydropteridine diphosphokinase [Actinomycetota bacterium]